MFDALRISARGLRRNAQCLEKRDDRLVPGLAFDGKDAPGVGQEHRAIRLRRDQAFALEALHRADDGYMRHAQHARQVCRAGLPMLGDQARDGLDIILRPLLCVLSSRPALDSSAFGRSWRNSVFDSSCLRGRRFFRGHRRNFEEDC